jgi:hypothetical protein
VTRSYNSFSGSDIRAVIGQYQFAELQAVSYSVTREKAPIYTLGSADVRPFSRNKRGIAGTLIWINFDRHGLLNLVHKMCGKYIANVDEVRSRCCISVHVLLSQNAIYRVSSLARVCQGCNLLPRIDERGQS